MNVVQSTKLIIFSGGVGGPAGPALAGALFDEIMNINIEFLMGATGLLHFTHHYYVCMRSVSPVWADCNGSS